MVLGVMDQPLRTEGETPPDGIARDRRDEFTTMHRSE